MAAHTYWKFNVTAAVNTRVQFYDIQLIDSTGAFVDRTGATVTESSFTSGEVGSRAFDASLNTAWAVLASALPAWVKIELASPADLAAFRLLSDSDGPVDLDVSWSDDDISYTPALDVEGLEWAQIIAFGGTAIRNQYKHFLLSDAAAPDSVAVLEAEMSVLGAPPTDPFITEAEITVVGAPPTGPFVTEAEVTILGFYAPCASERCQVWRIERTDGEVFAYTSHDEDVEFRGETYKRCNSLTDSASESSSEVGSVSSIALRGILSDDAITDEDIYGGLFDDAKVEVWEISWGEMADPVTPLRIGGGWIGKLSFGQGSYEAEVIGPGGKLQQAALVDFYQPGCRWEFGDENCQFDVDAITEHGGNVTGHIGRNTIFFDLPDPGGTTIWNGGKVVWTYGRNAGQECQVDTVDFASQSLTLWSLPAYEPAEGDQFNLVPGCPKDKPSCIVYANLINFGGFPDVPGPDTLQQSADAIFAG